MLKKEFKLIENTGIHARPATVLVQTASKFVSEITVGYLGQSTNLKSITGTMSHAVPPRAFIQIAAIEAFSEVIQTQNLGE